MMRGSRTARLLPPLLLLAVLGAMSLAHVRAEEPDSRLLQIERRLLCPQCTNLRLDVCETQICFDMRAQIRDRVAGGESDQQIIDYFTGRYGQRVLADVPVRGFNLLLFGWVGGSVALVAVVGTLVLLRLRRSANSTPVAPISDADERWLDEQAAADRERR